METLRIRFAPQSRLSRPTASFLEPSTMMGRCAGVGDASSVSAAFWRSATAGDHAALVGEEQTVSYADLRLAAWNVRRYLQSRDGFQPGTPVAIRLENSAEYVAAFYGILLADGVAVPLSPVIEHHRWEQICQSCRPKFVITHSGDDDAEWAPRSQETTTLDLLAELMPDDADPAVRRGDSDLAMILYTSGSTGAPKGVMLSHRNLLANTQSILEYLPIRGDDRALVVLPFYHAFGNSILLTHTLIGATLVLAGSPTFPVSIVQALDQERATSLSAVPELFNLLVRFARLDKVPLPHLRYMSVAGGALTPDLAQHIACAIDPARFYVMYGQTEATARLSYLPPEELVRRWGSIGRGIPGVELRVVDEQDAIVPPGQVGRLVARGHNVMLGYWEDASRSAPLLPDGWLDTGDLATVDDDGYIYLRGRASLLVKIQGHRVHPAEIEDVVKSRFPGAQAVVVPFESDGATRLALFAIPADGVPIGEHEIRQVCADLLPRHKIPSRIELLDRWPLNGAMKVDRQALMLRLNRSERKAC